MSDFVGIILLFVVLYAFLFCFAIVTGWMGIVPEAAVALLILLFVLMFKTK